MRGRGVWIVYENVKLQVKQLVCKGMWVLVMVLIGYGINDSKLRVWEKVDWVDAFPFWLQASSSEATGNKESVIASPVTPLYTLRKKRGTKTVSLKPASVLTRLLCSLVPWRSLNWLNGWGWENTFDADCTVGCTQN